MALPATTIWEVRTTGSDTANGGGFDPGQTAGMFTDLTVTSGGDARIAAPIVKSASYNFVSTGGVSNTGDVGAWLYIASGTNWTPGWYQIASVASNEATLSAAIGAAFTNSIRAPNTVAGCATVQTPTGGTWTIDYSQQGAAQLAYTDLSSTGVGLTVSSAAKPFGKQQVGNAVIVASGTNFTAGVYVIASVSGVTATVVGAANIHTGAGTDSDGAGGMGGAFLTISQAYTKRVAQNVIYVKATATYTLTGNAIATGGFSTGQCVTIGYTTVRGDNGQATFDASGMTASQDTFTIGDHSTMTNIIVSGSKRDSFAASGAQSGCVNCKSSSASRNGFNGIKQAINCYALSSTTDGFVYSTSSSTPGIFVNCYAKSCVVGFNASGGNGTIPAACVGCVARANSSHGFSGGENTTYTNCTSHGNTGSGFTQTDHCSFINCISYGNGVFGFVMSSSGSAEHGFMETCAAGNNTSGPVSNGGTVLDSVPIALTSDPCVSASGDNFALTNTAGGGAACRAAGFPGAFPGGATTGYLDVGAVQHANPLEPQNLLIASIGTY